MKISEVLLTTDVKFSPATALHAGELTAIYEEGRIRYISSGKEELIRMIYPALRSADWTTIYPSISNEKIVTGDKSFAISYTASYHAGDIQYKAEYYIEGYEDSRILFSMRGDALSTFQSKRIGFCILHPAETCAGKNVTITQPDGNNYASQFPEIVAPRQPFKNVRSMEWAIDDSSRVKVTMEGDIFETEDQRNYGDYSYKTYSRPSSLPAPFDVKPGDITDQKVTVQLISVNGSEKTVTHHLSELKFPLPKIGWSRAKQQPSLTEGEIALLKQVPFDHYSVTLSLNNPGWKDEFDTAVKESALLNTVLLLNVVFNEQTENEVANFIDTVTPASRVILSVLILTEGSATAPHDFFTIAYNKLKGSFPQLLIGYGVMAHFVELNRARPDGLTCDFINYQSLPQAHLSDSRTIIENLENGPAVINTANYFSENKPIHISPIIFTKRGYDERLHTWFGAWYTLGTISYLAEADRLCFYELKGEMGLLHGNEPTPLFKAMKALKEFSPDYVLLNTGNDIIFENKSGGRLVFKSDFRNLKHTN